MVKRSNARIAFEGARPGSCVLMINSVAPVVSSTSDKRARTVSGLPMMLPDFN